MDTSQDTEIAGFQDEVRNLVIKLSGAPGSQIDGAGSDAGWQEFTLAEIAQGFAYVSECHQREVEALRGEVETDRDCIESLRTRLVNSRSALQKSKECLESAECIGVHDTMGWFKRRDDALAAIKECL